MGDAGGERAGREGVEMIYIQYSCMKFSQKCKKNNNDREINIGFFLAVQEVQVFHFGD